MKKSDLKKRGKTLVVTEEEKTILKGYMTSGLFRYSRHPNFFCEISIWYIYYCFSMEEGGVANWTLVGAVLLNLLFLGSTAFTESLSLEKYPSYKDY